MQETEKLIPDNWSKKDASASAEAAHMVCCFWRKCSAVFDPEWLSDVNKRKASKSHSVPHSLIVHLYD